MEKILLADIETSPCLGWFWRPGYNLNISDAQIIEECQIICISYKWSGQKKIHKLKWDVELGPSRDAKLLQQFIKVFNSADAVVAHNGNKFDWPTIRGRILYHNLPPLAPVKQIDTLLEARKLFKLNSNKLNYLDKFLGGPGKIDCPLQVWLDCSFSTSEKVRAEALQTMVDYCDGDIEALERVYIALEKHTFKHRKNAVKDDFGNLTCICGSQDFQKRGYYHTSNGKQQRLSCIECGKWSSCKLGAM